jgi:hypothetical protein
MTDNSMHVLQPSYVPVSPHPPADDRGIAPANRVGPGGVGNTAPQPAAHELKVLPPETATDPKATEKQTETDFLALEHAKENLANLKLEGATPEEISKAEHAVDVARGKAELATMDNVTVQSKSCDQWNHIWAQVNTELNKLEQEVRDNPTNSSAASRLHAASNNFLLRAYDNHLTESSARFVHAQAMLFAVAGVPMPHGHFTDVEVAYYHYPSLVFAEGKYRRASDLPLNSGEPKVVTHNLAQLRQAAVELLTAWTAARTDANKGDYALLKKVCAEGFATAEVHVRRVTNPDFVKAQENR